MNKISPVLIVLIFIVWAVPCVQAGTSANKSFKLSVTIPESVGQPAAPATTVPPSTNTTVQSAAFKGLSQGFQLIEAQRGNQKVVLVTYVVE